MDSDNCLSRLLEQVSTPDTSDDPYQFEGGEYGSDGDYRSSTGSDLLPQHATVITLDQVIVIMSIRL